MANCISVTVSQPSSTYSVLEKSSPVCGVVSVHTSKGVWGSGIVLQDDVIITCAHVIHHETGKCD